MKSKIIIISCLVAGMIIVVFLYAYVGPIFISQDTRAFDDNVSQPTLPANSLKKQHSTQTSESTPTPIPTPTPTSASTSASTTTQDSKLMRASSPVALVEDFSVPTLIKEAGSMDSSESAEWWLSSGAYFYSVNGIGSTILGALPALNSRRVSYYRANPLDTDNGYYPQNIFRLVLRSKWRNYTQEAYFRIVKDNLTESPNRNASNGLLLFNRYQDEFNLYYTGIRVDGYAVIKKKINGTYYTMAYKRLINGPKYDATTNPNLLPKNVWIGLRSVVQNNTDDTVSIKLYVDNGKTGNWTLAAQAEDDGKTYGGRALVNAGYAGIRTDFMDVEFDDYKIRENN